jgi:hypothetical protein
VSSGAQYENEALQPKVQPATQTTASLQALFLILSKITAWLRKKKNTQKSRCDLRCISNRAHKIRCRERARVLFDYPTRYTLPEVADLMNSSIKEMVETKIDFAVLGPNFDTRRGAKVPHHPSTRTAAEISSVLALHHLSLVVATVGGSARSSETAEERCCEREPFLNVSARSCP